VPQNAKSGASVKKQTLLDQPFQPVSARRLGDKNVPQLVLSGEWLKAVGFPIGSGAIVTTDRRGELTLHRLGLAMPRRLRIRASK
jgi:hypothetical protein